MVLKSEHYFVAYVVVMLALVVTYPACASCVTGYACSLKDLNKMENEKSTFPFPKIAQQKEPEVSDFFVIKKLLETLETKGLQAVD